MADSVRGRLHAQLAGQQLRALDRSAGDDPDLYYRQHGGGRPGEIDYLVQIGHRVVPVELESGAVGAMKALHMFVHERGLRLALRVDTNPPTLQDIEVGTPLGDRARYRILNLPGHLLFRAAELLAGITAD